MENRPLRPALVLSLWTLLVWTTRIRNIWSDTDLSTAEQLWRTGLALVFTAFALATFGVWIRARTAGSPTSRGAGLVVRAFAVWTVSVWAVRGAQIVRADHSVAFVTVHTALAIASIGLAVWADRSVRAAGADQPVPA